MRKDKYDWERRLGHNYEMGWVAVKPVYIGSIGRILYYIVSALGNKHLSSQTMWCNLPFKRWFFNWSKLTGGSYSNSGNRYQQPKVKQSHSERI